MKWLLILTQTGIQGEGRNPAHVVVETYSQYEEALSAMRQMYADKVDCLKDELEYCEFDLQSNNARLFGELAVIVIAIKHIESEVTK